MTKYKHGQPGIGITGKLGETGFHGNSFYVDKIDNFFTYITQEMLDEYGLSNINLSYLKDEKHLHPKYKNGDVLYILDDSSILYKSIELSKEHILCTKQYLENSKYIKYPLSILNQEIDNPEILHCPLNMSYVYNGSVPDSLYNNQELYSTALINGSYIYDMRIKSVESENNKEQTILNYYTNIPYMYDPTLNYYNSVNNGKNIVSYTFKNDLSTDISVNNTNIQLLELDSSLEDNIHRYLKILTNRLGVNINSSFIKCNNLYIKKYNKGNVESLYTLYDINLNIDNEGHCYTLNSTDYNPNTLEFKIDKTRFFKNIPDNIDDYHIGYIHTMYNNNPSVNTSYNQTYGPNYINDKQIITVTYRDISTDTFGGIIRDWNILEDIIDMDIKDLLSNCTIDQTLNDVSDKLPKTVNAEYIKKYIDTSGIIVTYDRTADIEFDVIKTPDLQYEYFQTDIENVSNLLYTRKIDPSDGSLTIDTKKINTKGFIDSDVLKIFDSSFYSNIIYNKDITSNIPLIHYDKNIQPYYHQNILTWIQTPEGFKYYSNPTKIEYNLYDNEYKISVTPQSFIDNLIDIENIENNVFIYTIIPDNSNNVLTINNPNLYNIQNIYVNSRLSKSKKDISNNITDISINIDKYDTSVSSFINDSSILQVLYDNKMTSMNSYKIPVMIEYLNDSSILQYDYYNITANGYTEYRKFPKVDLHIYDDMDSLESFNDVNKGILCNQYQFFMKISISDFDKDNWGKLYNDLNLKIYIKPNNIDKFTGRIISSYNVYNNEEIYKMYLLPGDIDIYKLTVKELTEVSIQSINNIDNFNISTSINGSKDFYIRFFIEHSNPLPTIYHFAYTVDKLEITGGLNSSINLTDVYNSNHFYTTVIPISMTAEYDHTFDAIDHTGLKVYGSNDTLNVTIYPFELDYVKTLYMDLTSRLIQEENFKKLNWNSYMLKNRYLQDNIESINITPININNLYSVLPNNLYKNEWLAKDSDDVYNSYLQVAYDVSNYSILMNDEEIFYYNNNMFVSSQYSLISNNTAVFINQSITKNVRTLEHIESLNVWNTEYQKLYYKDSDTPFKGHNSVYGNGYQYMENQYDNGQYTNDGVISLNNIKNIMELNILENDLYQIKLDIPELQDNYTPGILFSSLVKQVKWSYPKYDTSNGLNIIYPLDFTDSVLMNTNIDDISNYMPYNLAYTIYPRILFNDETLMHITLMLRRPTVNNIDTSSKQQYVLDENIQLASPLNVMN